MIVNHGYFIIGDYLRVIQQLNTVNILFCILHAKCLIVDYIGTLQVTVDSTVTLPPQIPPNSAQFTKDVPPQYTSP